MFRFQDLYQKSCKIVQQEKRKEKKEKLLKVKMIFYQEVFGKRKASLKEFPEPFKTF